jgi:hypothetical protein
MKNSIGTSGEEEQPSTTRSKGKKKKKKKRHSIHSEQPSEDIGEEERSISPTFNNNQNMSESEYESSPSPEGR